MKSTKNDKSSGSDGLTKEFYVIFWDDIKATFISSLKQAKERKKLSISQREAIIKLIEKKDRDKRYIQNWKTYFIVECRCKNIIQSTCKKTKRAFTMPNICTTNCVYSK